MLPVDFNATFNAAVKSEDWPLVTILGESAVAEKGATSEIIYNLGLAYLKTSKAPMAVSVFLSVPPEKQDQAFRTARDEALRVAGASKDDLDLGAHGGVSAVMHAARVIDRVDPYSWCVGALGLVLLCGVAMIFGKKNKKINSALKWTLVSSLVLTLISGAAIGVSYFYQSHWGAVVASDGAAIRVIPGPEAEVTKNLKPGKPVLVLGDAYMPWIRVIESDGGSGWMNALDVRVIHE